MGSRGTDRGARGYGSGHLGTVRGVGEGEDSVRLGPRERERKLRVGQAWCQHTEHNLPPSTHHNIP
eukprot:3940544-Rhodomonas_salina.2